MQDLRRNIGIFAHVDAGKTTLSEQILFNCGAIRRLGRVDDGTAHTDSMPIERERGISVRSGTVCVNHNGVHIRIIDTPGHIDFSAEVENALVAVDGAVLVVSAVEGVQAQTLTILGVLRALNIPTIAFINKVDRVGADVERVALQLKQIAPLPLLLSDNEGVSDVLSRIDDSFLALALEGTPTKDDIDAALGRACANCACMPLLQGSALKGQGIAELLHAIVHYLPAPTIVQERSVAAYDVKHLGEERQVFLRVFGGEIALGMLPGHGRIHRLRRLTPAGFENTQTLSGGDIGMAVGLAMRAGDFLGTRVRGRPQMALPLLRAEVAPDNRADLPALLSALNLMHDEQPGLKPVFETRTRKVHVNIMGEIHAQTIAQQLAQAHGVAAQLLEPKVLYKETPLGQGSGKLDAFFAPWMARATFNIAPAPRGSGIHYESLVALDFLHLRYQRDIEQTVYQALEEGLFGWPITDIAVTLSAAQSTSISWPGSRFGPVVPLGLFAALNDARTCLLEPLLSFVMHIDERLGGVALHELAKMRAQIDTQHFTQGQLNILGKVPAAASQHFAMRLNEITRARAQWHTTFYGFDIAPEGEGYAIERTTPDPSNPSLFMDYITGRVK